MPKKELFFQNGCSSVIEWSVTLYITDAGNSISIPPYHLFANRTTMADMSCNKCGDKGAAASHAEAVPRLIPTLPHPTNHTYLADISCNKNGNRVGLLHSRVRQRCALLGRSVGSTGITDGEAVLGSGAVGAAAGVSALLSSSTLSTTK